MVLDGAMGTMIQRYGLTGNNDCLNLTHPDIIEEIHGVYIEAGADLIETNTFSSNRISQKEYGLDGQAREMALQGARIARKAADAAEREVWVAGSIGPTSQSLTLVPDLAGPSEAPCRFDEMTAAYREQVEALIEGGVDLLLIETCFDALNAKAALYAVGKAAYGFPVIVSVSPSDKSGRTLTGQTLEAFYAAVRHYPLTAFGLNCSLGAEELAPLLQEVSRFCDVPVICYPNAGLPNELGGYDETPFQMAAAVGAMATAGQVNIVGGCCGTTPSHIAAERQAVLPCPPRLAPEREKHLTISGLEAVTVDVRTSNLTLIGERTNVAGSRKFARLIAQEDYDSDLQVAADQVAGGASIIDINMDDAMLDGPAAMEKFVRCVQNDPAVAKAALMIDSSHWECILAGLKNAQGKCIVNSISLKDGEDAFLQKALEIRNLGAAMVVMAFDEEGQAATYARKTAIARRAYRLLTSHGISPEDIIFDVNVLSVGTGIPEHDRYAVDFIEAVRWIKSHLPGVSTSGGISNLSFAFRGNNPVRSAMHAVFLYHAVQAGLDMAIVNPGQIIPYDDIEPELRRCAEDVILCRDAGATGRLIAKAAMLSGMPEERSAVQEAPAPGTPQERLREALVSGRTDRLEADLMQVLEELGSAVQVIEGPLMTGMEEVGARFGAGKMVLPQVVKSAKVMKDAVTLLEPYMAASTDTPAARPVIIHATVKGDVHDIGKNIAGIVLRCNGFEVVDLGVMVDKETILDAAVRHHAALIGVSGLITPSLFQMEEICREMAARGMDTPLLIGGATTSALHTAVKLAPLYDHVFYAADASAGAVLAKRLLLDRHACEAARHAEQARLRILHARRKVAGPSAEMADFPPESYPSPGEYHFEDIIPQEIPVEDLQPYFDWRLFQTVWGMKEPQPELLEEGKAMLERFIARKSLRVFLSVRFFEARREGDDLVLGDGLRLPMLRQEEGQRRSLADFVPQDGTGPVGLFALSVHEHGHPDGCTCEACRSDYGSMMGRSVKVTLAEAASAWLDDRLERRVDRPDTRIIKPAAGYASCPDHSLKRDILRLLPETGRLGISLTETCTMRPDAAICGFIFLHPEASYPEIRHISHAQYERYAAARGLSPDEARLFLSHLL